MNRWTLFLLLWLAGAGLFAQVTDVEKGELPRISGDSLPRAVSADGKVAVHSHHAHGPLEGCVAACVGACTSLGCGLVWDFARWGLWNYHFKMTDTKPEVPRVISLDMMLQGGMEPNVGYSLIPRLRFNFGFFGTDFRYVQTAANRQTHIESFYSLDWQMLVLNLLNVKPVHLRLGTGIMYFSTDDDWLHESTAALDVYLLDEALFLQTEGRLSVDYLADLPSRWELSGGFNVRFLYGDHIWGYANVGGMYQSYSGTPVRTVMGGLRFNLH